jgi:predicted signal transduction protein with EAL and GGDEF domain
VTAPGLRDLPWHRRLDARVAVALGLLVSTTLGVVLAATLGVLAAHSRDRVAADLSVARSAFHDLLALRITGAIDVAGLVARLPAFRAAAIGTPAPAAARPGLTAFLESQRRERRAAFLIVARPSGAWLADAGWRSTAESGIDVVRTAQHRAATGHATGAVVQDGQRVFLAVAVPVTEGDRVAATLILGFPFNDEVVSELARLARVEAAIVAHGAVAASSLGARATRNADAIVRATMTAPGVKPDAFGFDGRQYVAGVYPLLPGVPGGEGVQLLLLSDWAFTKQFLDTLGSRFVLVGVLALVLALAGGVALSRHLSRPLREVATAASEIAGGNLELQLPVRGTAEAATVAQAFNAMSRSLKSAHERLVHAAIHDHLTQLPNRALFAQRLQRALARRARRRDYQFAVLFVDLDRFKHVNDSLGHTAGDRLLVMFAERLSAAVRAEDVVTRLPGAGAMPEPTLARFGGDEFAVLLDGIREPLDAVRVAKRVQQMAEAPLSLDGQDVFATASIGVAVATDAHTSAEDIIRDADLAMYRAKHGGSGGYSVFDAALHEMAVRRLRLETDLRRAAERGEFRVWYQPIVAFDTGRIAGVEALVRWQHPEHGLVPPGEFLHVADELGLLAQIDEWVLAEACRQARAWRDAGAFAPEATVSVNLSARAFTQDGLAARVAAVLRETGCPASALRLEITESAAIKDAARARAALADLRRIGVRISLDDFGTGYSSLSYLQSLPLDVLKIDRSFVSGIGSDADKGEIVRLIVGLADGLGLEIVAEGVETSLQVEHLRALGCHYGQGYHFAKPSEARDALTLAGPSAASARRGAVAARLGGLSAPASPLPPSAR